MSKFEQLAHRIKEILDLPVPMDEHKIENENVKYEIIKKLVKKTYEDEKGV